MWLNDTFYTSSYYHLKLNTQCKYEIEKTFRKEPTCPIASDMIWTVIISLFFIFFIVIDKNYPYCTLIAIFQDFSFTKRWVYVRNTKSVRCVYTSLGVPRLHDNELTTLWVSTRVRRIPVYTNVPTHFEIFQIDPAYHICL